MSLSPAQDTPRVVQGPGEMGRGEQGSGHSARISVGEIITLNGYMATTKLEGKVPYLVRRRFLIWSPVRREIPSCVATVISLSARPLPSLAYEQRVLLVLLVIVPTPPTANPTLLGCCKVQVQLGYALNRFEFNTRKMRGNLKGKSRCKTDWTGRANNANIYPNTLWTFFRRHSLNLLLFVERGEVGVVPFHALLWFFSSTVTKASRFAHQHNRYHLILWYYIISYDIRF